MIHPKALVDDANAIGPGTDVWAFAHVMAGARVGSNCNLGDHVFVEAGAVVGNNVTLKNHVLVWEGITIEDDVFVGPGVVFTNDPFPRSPRMLSARQRYAHASNWRLSTVVQRGCSIGAGAIICPGVKLGNYSMIGAGSVVTRDVEPHTLVVGSPARRIHYICSCGQKLAGHFLNTDCQVCGETGAERGEKIAVIIQFVVGGDGDGDTPKRHLIDVDSRTAADSPPSDCAPIPLVDLQTQSRALKDDVLRRMCDVIEGARYILGKEVEEFEEQFAAYCGTKHCVGLANGTEAIHLAIRALGIGRGDEVITAGNSFAATAYAIAHAGADAVLVDIHPSDFNIDVTLIEQAISERTKAIIPVHLYGQPARMKEIREIADRYNLKIIEDSAQAHGAEIDGRRCGSFGDIGCFSFYPGKNLGAFGDGGAIVTNSAELAETVRLLRNYGQKQKNRHDLLGFNSRLDTLQACVLLSKMQHIEKWTEQRRAVATWYREALANVGLLLPAEREGVRHVYHLFVVRSPRRDQLIAALAKKNIGCGIHYPNPLSTAQPFINDAPTIPLGLPVCSEVANQIVSLPMYPEMKRDQVSRIADAVREFVAQQEPCLELV